MSAFIPSVTSMLQADDMDLTRLLALRRDLERFRLLVENCSEVVAEAGRDGRLVYVSPNVHARLGFWPRELVGERMLDWVHPDDVSDMQAQSTLPEGLATCRFRHNDGSWRSLEISIRDFFTPEGEKHTVLIARDVAAREDIENAQRPKLALNEPPRLAHKPESSAATEAGVAHDLNNILDAITAYTDLARLDTRDSRDVQGYLNEVLKACERARALIREIGGVLPRPDDLGARAEASGCASTAGHFPLIP